MAAQELQDPGSDDLTDLVKLRGGEGAVAIAWSLGSLLALRAWNAGNWPEGMPLVAVCPVVDFCAEAGPWRRLHLDRMIRGLSRGREAVLEDFRKLVWEEMPPELADPWREQASRIPVPSLVRGLEILRDDRLSMIRPGAGLVLIEGTGDRVSPSLDAVLGKADLALLSRRTLATGHVPFLEDPEGFGRILSEL
ncbi:MAG: hypothetical protein RL318_836 [Fibrobacterota bacterium]